MTILVVDPEYTPDFPAIVLRTCEEATEFLLNTPVEELWLRHDADDMQHVLSLIDFIIEMKPWEEGPRIDRIVIFSEAGDADNVIAQKLAPLYPITFETLQHFTATVSR